MTARIFFASSLLFLAFAIGAIYGKHVADHWYERLERRKAYLAAHPEAK